MQTIKPMKRQGETARATKTKENEQQEIFSKKQTTEGSLRNEDAGVTRD